MAHATPPANVYVSFDEPLGHKGRVWLLVDGEYREITDFLIGVTLDGRVGAPTKATLTLDLAATGMPPGVFS